MNIVVIKGNLTDSPELKNTANGKSVTTMRMAVSRYGYGVDYFDVVVWNKTAEAVAKFLKKGSAVLVRGTLQNRTWEGRDGTKRKVTEIVADEVDFLDKKPASPEQEDELPIDFPAPRATPQETPNAPPPTLTTIAQRAVPDLSGFEELDPNDELPF